MLEAIGPLAPSERRTVGPGKVTLLPNELPIVRALAVLSNLWCARIFVFAKLGAREKSNRPQMLGNRAR